MESALLPGLFLAGMFVGLHAILRRYGDDRLYRRMTLIIIALSFAVVFSIILAIQLGVITDHYP